MPLPLHLEFYLVKSEVQLHRLSLILKAAIIYFALVFGAGFILGTTRVLFVVPRFGERVAELMESPLMLGVTILAARWIVRRFRIPTAFSDRIAVGSVALVLLIIVEFTIVLWLRGLTLADYFRARDPLSGTVYYLLLILLAVMPLFVRRKPVISNY